MSGPRTQNTLEQQAPTVQEAAVRGAVPQGTFEARLERYELLDALGEGGMGKVHRARDTETGELVALKLVELSHAGSVAEQDLVRERFERELRTAASLSHPNICRVLSYGRAPGQLFLAMELVEGITLQRLIEARGTLPVPVALEVLRQLLEALAHAHVAGITHRDLKPPNIMITPDGVVKLLDFGIARAFGDATLTATGFLVGTPSFMAPEQVNGKGASARTDLFSAGVTLLAMLTGRWRWQNLRPAVVMQKIRTDPVPPLLEECALAPPALDRFFGVLCAQSEERRFASAQDALAALETLGLLVAPAAGCALLARYQKAPDHVVEELSRAAAAAELAHADALLSHGGSEVAAALALHRASLLDPSPQLRKRLKSLCAAARITFDPVDDAETAPVHAAYERDPTVPGVLKRLSDLYRVRGHMLRAASFLTRYLRVAPEDAVAASQLCALVEGSVAERAVTAERARPAQSQSRPPPPATGVAASAPLPARAPASAPATAPPGARVVVQAARTKTSLPIGPLAALLAVGAIVVVVFAAFQMLIRGSADAIQDSASKQDETVTRAEERATTRAQSQQLAAARAHHDAGQHSSAIRQVTLLLASAPPAQDALEGLWIRARSSAQVGDVSTAQNDLRAFLKDAAPDDPRRADAETQLAALAGKGP